MWNKGHILDWRMFCLGEVDPLWDGPHPLWNIQHRLTLLTLIVSFLFLLQVSYSDFIQKADCLIHIPFFVRVPFDALKLLKSFLPESLTLFNDMYWFLYRFPAHPTFDLVKRDILLIAARPIPDIAFCFRRKACPVINRMNRDVTSFPYLSKAWVFFLSTFL